MIFVSVIIATYNWPEALDLCLKSLRNQSVNNYEILIADDGSKDSTRKLVESYSQNFPVSITHLWQEDIGCRKTLIGNKGIFASKGNYLVFLDGDCVVQPDFIENHIRLAKKGCVVTGSRILLSQKFTQQLLSTNRFDFNRLKTWAFFFRLKGYLNKFLPLYIKLNDGPWRNYKKFVWRRIKGCNMACWKADAMRINGFDETITGWGHEDADFIFRLENIGMQRKSGSWSTEVLHLFHKVRDQSNNSESTKKLLNKIQLMRSGQYK